MLDFVVETSLLGFGVSVPTAWYLVDGRDSWRTNTLLMAWCDVFCIGQWFNPVFAFFEFKLKGDAESFATMAKGLVCITPVERASFETLIGLLPQIPAEDGDHNDPETRYEHLAWMCREALSNVQKWPADKVGRWTGFIQGVLAVRSSKFSVKAERDRTRPIFHEAYEKSGYRIPATAVP